VSFGDNVSGVFGEKSNEPTEIGLSPSLGPLIELIGE
jgi:hypothetical protein